ncbi:MAG: hypothetical protein KME40_24730 [Komarekiella atlantica HA4396-MV6]|jgi:hypothetical protein|nr:hypothetical protein [Komarekiella atlantica HA4396-MV6]
MIQKRSVKPTAWLRYGNFSLHGAGSPSGATGVGSGGISNLGGTSKNFEMLIRLSFHVKLTPMGIAVPLREIYMYQDFRELV